MQITIAVGVDPWTLGQAFAQMSGIPGALEDFVHGATNLVEREWDGPDPLYGFQCNLVEAGRQTHDTPEQMIVTALYAGWEWQRDLYETNACAEAWGLLRDVSGDYWYRDDPEFDDVPF